jgi:Nucleotidyl transferase
MDAVILAAGLGTRLRPYTLATPKPLLPVQGRPILDWALGALPAAVDRVLVVVNYLAEQIEAYLQKQQRIAQWQIVRQVQPRGTGDALRVCRGELRSERFLVLNGDDLFGARDLAALAGCSAGLLVSPVDEPRRFGIAFLRPDGSLERLVEKPDLDGRQLSLPPRRLPDRNPAICAGRIRDYRLCERPRRHRASRGGPGRILATDGHGRSLAGSREHGPGWATTGGLGLMCLFLSRAVLAAGAETGFTTCRFAFSLLPLADWFLKS